MNSKHVKIHADSYFDAAEAAGVLDQANDGSWDECLGLKYRFIESISCSETLTFEIVDAKKYFMAEIKYGFKGTSISFTGEQNS